MSPFDCSAVGVAKHRLGWYEAASRLVVGARKEAMAWRRPDRNAPTSMMDVVWTM